MQEGKRQKQVASLLQKELSDIFQRLGLNIVGGAMISISEVKITPDLLEARIYLSIFQGGEKEATLKKVTDHAWEIKRDLASRVKHQLRRIPELQFFLDDTLDQVFRMEEILRKIKEQDTPGNS